MKNVTGILTKITLALIMVFSLGVGPLQISAAPLDSSGVSSESGESSEPSESEGEAQPPSGSTTTTTPESGSELGGEQAVEPGGELESAPSPDAITPLAVMYTVQFYTWDDLPLGSPVEVEEGTTVPAEDVPIPPERPGYRFVGWSESLDNVSENLDPKAEYVPLNSFAITINYKFADNTLARQPLIYSVEEGGSFNQTITSPTIAGYTPDQPTVPINLTNVQTDHTYTVTYTPATNTPYTVQHYQQKLVLVNAGNPHDPVNYDLVTTQNLTGTTGAVALAVSQAYTGFTAPTPMPSALIAASGTTNLRVYYDRNQYAIYFNSAGGSYVNPIAALYGATISAPANPTRAGYTFAGWSAAVPGTMPANDVTLTANWTPSGTVGYTLVYYLENISSTGYDYVGTANQSATAGTAPTYPATVPGSVTFPIPSNRFAINATKTNAELPAAVSGDGSTIVNVYYDRNSYTINFNFNAAKYSLTVAGTTYNTSPYQLTAKFGASINAKWPTSAPQLRPGQTSDGTFVGWDGSSVTYVTTQYFMDNNLISNSPITADFDPNAKNITVYYYFRNVVGTGYTSNFTQLVAVDPDSDTWNAKSFQGFTVQDSQVEIVNNTATFYYDRNQYQITYYNGVSIDRTSTNVFQANISGASYSAAPSGRPANIPANYTFAGWYTSPQGFDNTKFVFTGATMPPNNLILYARWDKPTYTAVFNPDNGAPTFSQTVVALTTLTTPTPPVKPGYIFGGWYLPSSTLKYNFSFPVNSNLNLTAHWIPSNNISYDVIYQKEGVEFQRQTIGGKTVGDTVTANAIIVPGYLPNFLSQSLVLAASGNQIIFNYTPFTTVGYTVKYVDTNGIPLATQKTASTSQASVTENYLNIPGYYPNYYQQTLVLSPNPLNNVITFVYTKNADVNYTLRILLENLDGSYTTDVDQVKQAPAGSRVDEPAPPYSGYSFEPGLSINNRIIASDGSTIIRLVYNRLQYDIDFYASANGSLVGTTGFDDIKHGTPFGTAVTTPTPVADPGYQFVGWTPTLPGSSSPVTADADYTATFEKDDSQWATVTFDGNTSTSGSMPPSAEMLIGSSYVLPPNLFEKDNNTFVNWDTEAAGDGYSYHDQETITVNGDMTLYAQWVQDEQFMVIYLGNGGIGTLTDPNPYFENDEVTVLDNTFVYPGYEFTGWEDEDGNSYDPQDVFNIQSTTYLYAQWEYDEDQWSTLIYDKNNAGATGTMANETVLINQPHTLTTNAYTLEHFVFTGWSTNPGGGSTYPDAGSITPTVGGDLTLYAQWSEIPKHTITYVANNGTSDTTTQTDYEGSTVTILSGNTFSYLHNDFARWTTNANGTGMSYFPGNTVTLTTDITVYALWVPRMLYTVTYLDGYGSGSVSESDYADAMGNLDITVDDNPFVRQGYTFNHWLSDTSEIAYPGNVINDIHADMSFTAQWDLIDYNIQYDLDGGTVSGVNPTQYNAETPTFEIINPTKPGYTFTGWTGTNLSGETVDLTINQGTTGDLSFTAHWVYDPLQWATVTFMGNGSDGGSMPPSEEMLIGTSYQLPTNAFTKSYYSFVDWNTDAAGAGDSYLNEETIVVNEDLTLYAQWIPLEYTIEYDLDGGTVSDNPVGYNTETPTFDINKPTKPGYIFTGWTGTNLTEETIDLTISQGTYGNLFYTAHWLRDDSQWSTITFVSSDETKGALAGTLVYEGIKGTPIVSNEATPLIKLFAANPAIAVNYPMPMAYGGYAFEGWSQAVPTVFPESNLVITGYFDGDPSAAAAGVGTTGMGGFLASTGDTLTSIIPIALGILALAALALGLGLRQRKRSKAKN